MKIKPILLAVFFVQVSLVFFVGSVSALTVDQEDQVSNTDSSCTFLTYYMSTTLTRSQNQNSYTYSRSSDVNTNGEVSELQSFLKNHGYMNKSAITTGSYGPLTKLAIAKFQRTNSITVTGATGPLTRTKIAQISGCSMSATGNSNSPVKEVFLEVSNNQNSSFVKNGTVINNTPLYTRIYNIQSDVKACVQIVGQGNCEKGLDGSYRLFNNTTTDTWINSSTVQTVVTNPKDYPANTSYEVWVKFVGVNPAKIGSFRLESPTAVVPTAGITSSNCPDGTARSTTFGPSGTGCEGHGEGAVLVSGCKQGEIPVTSGTWVPPQSASNPKPCNLIEHDGTNYSQKDHPLLPGQIFIAPVSYTYSPITAWTANYSKEDLIKLYNAELASNNERKEMTQAFMDAYGYKTLVMPSLDQAINAAYASWEIKWKNDHPSYLGYPKYVN